MIRITSIEQLFELVKQQCQQEQEKILVILIAGCSRSGKSTLCTELGLNLKDAGVKHLILNLDSWLISVDKRKPNSRVIERYEMDKINHAVDELLCGKTIKTPVYDPVSRKRLSETKELLIAIASGVLIVEGVVALSDKTLMQKARLKIFVEVPNTTRIKRLFDFYSNVKKLPRAEYKSIIADREKEETLFIKKTAVNADVIFNKTFIPA